MSDDQEALSSPEAQRRRLTSALRRVVLLKETGPKSAAWHRARVRTIWRLHRELDRAGEAAPAEGQSPPEERS